MTGTSDVWILLTCEASTHLVQIFSYSRFLVIFSTSLADLRDADHGFILTRQLSSRGLQFEIQPIARHRHISRGFQVRQSSIIIGQMLSLITAFIEQEGTCEYFNLNIAGVLCKKAKLRPWISLTEVDDLEIQAIHTNFTPSESVALCHCCVATFQIVLFHVSYFLPHTNCNLHTYFSFRGVVEQIL